jgi:transcriptional antiterminator
MDLNRLDRKRLAKLALQLKRKREKGYRVTGRSLQRRECGERLASNRRDWKGEKKIVNGNKWWSRY